ncbi:MAG: Single-stranded DNA-binding protein [Hydrogenibacillus schlegelii]|uniref:Single-stranded DNA-binding protein n=1 Tax=Hydrogenibacillus schlegelii TaxID=1484 RepID=A0A2T5G4E6_HYDSH|nr:single-stranded DNA-binding protein [Hydrogenibacillus schlegelii]PTQ51039.1 MAG: Single-stranded DNA-binding protein [Hydrogenibacillus schlegelii]
MVNHVVLVGRLTRDPELQYTASGTAVTVFTVAVDRPFKNARGEREADFIRVVAWRKLGEVVAEYVQKGRLVAVEGSLRTRSFENNEGRRVYVTEVVADSVVFLERPPKNGGGKAGKAAKADEKTKEEPAELVDAFAGAEEDLPF